MARGLGRAAVLAVLCGLTMLVTAGTGSATPLPAHPLGNFSVNHYNGLRIFPDRVDVTAIVDSAEIPTLQEKSAVDTDGDGAVSGPEADREATLRCDELTVALRGSVSTGEGDDQPLRWSVRTSRVDYPPGQAELPTTRLTCELTADTRIDRPVTVSLTDSYREDRVGWREITATGTGIALPDSPVPARSVTDELRAYPEDVLSDPMDVRSTRLRVEPGVGFAPVDPARGEPGAIGAAVDWATTAFTDLVGTRDLTPWLGTLALLLSLVLGASHAALPGHGKTVIAAYLAGRRGTTMDAVIVGATVTITHTAGVLVMGLVFSLSSAFAGESVLRWLGAASGLLIAGIGAVLLRSAVRQRAHDPTMEPVLVGAGHGHGHSHGHGHGHGHSHEPRFGKASLVGMGVAGGLVPSPSALVVLLGAIALGRTWFGVLLVLGYGAGMAATLTAAGLLLIKVRDRFDHLALADRLRGRSRRLLALTPAITATMVLVVGLGLAVRSFA